MNDKFLSFLRVSDDVISCAWTVFLLLLISNLVFSLFLVRSLLLILWDAFVSQLFGKAPFHLFFVHHFLVSTWLYCISYFVSFCFLPTPWITWLRVSNIFVFSSTQGYIIEGVTHIYFIHMFLTLTFCVLLFILVFFLFFFYFSESSFSQTSPDINYIKFALGTIMQWSNPAQV